MSKTYTNVIRVTFNNDTQKPIIYTFHHLLEELECINRIYKMVEKENKDHHRNDRVNSIEFLHEYVTVTDDLK